MCRESSLKSAYQVVFLCKFYKCTTTLFGRLCVLTSKLGGGYHKRNILFLSIIWFKELFHLNNGRNSQETCIVRITSSAVLCVPIYNEYIYKFPDKRLSRHLGWFVLQCLRVFFKWHCCQVLKLLHKPEQNLQFLV